MPFTLTVYNNFRLQFIVIRDIKCVNILFNVFLIFDTFLSKINLFFFVFNSNYVEIDNNDWCEPLLETQRDSYLILVTKTFVYVYNLPFLCT